MSQKPIRDIGPVTVTDVSGQRSFRVDSIPSDASIDEVVAKLLSYLPQPSHDAAGRPLTYAVRSEREGRFLGASELVENSVEPEDTLRLMPSIDAG